MIASQDFVKTTFNHFNALCFEGALPVVPIALTKARSFLGKMEYKSRRDFFGIISSHYDFRLKISTGFDLSQEELEDVIIHEMIHYYIAWRNIKDSSVHGEVFRGIMEQINSRYGRHITIRHKTEEGQLSERMHEPSKHYVCITSFRDGKRFVTVAASTKIFELHRYFSLCPDITCIQWYGTLDPFFDRYPRSKTPRVYKITEEEIMEHLGSAVVFSCDGHNLIPNATSSQWRSLKTFHR